MDLKKNQPETDFIIITGYGTINSAVEAMRYGALNYLIKPVEPQDIIRYVDLVRRRHLHRSENEDSDRFHGLVGKSSNMRKIFTLIPKIAQMHGSVLIQGETGVGKELVAQAIHKCSKRRERKFVPVDCGSLSDSLLESELFGHKQGAFTGSTSDRAGLIEHANGGSLFLDEIGNSSLLLQSRLLRVIEEKKVRRVGENNYNPADVRVIAACNEDLKDLMEQERFRQDLYYRLSGFVIDIPPLRDRLDDIPLLANYFLQENNKIYNFQIKGFSSQAMEHIMKYNWPGNIRELRIVIERAVAMVDQDIIEKKDLIFDNPIYDQVETEILPTDDTILNTPFYTAVESYERMYLAKLFDKVEGNISRASQLSGASRKTIREKGKKYGLL
jgi:two-component system response regulator AtoC